jgi:hypothetical protein
MKHAVEALNQVNTRTAQRQLSRPVAFQRGQDSATIYHVPVKFYH